MCTMNKENVAPLKKGQPSASVIRRFCSIANEKSKLSVLGAATRHMYNRRTPLDRNRKPIAFVDSTFDKIGKANISSRGTETPLPAVQSKVLANSPDEKKATNIANAQLNIKKAQLQGKIFLRI